MREHPRRESSKNQKIKLWILELVVTHGVPDTIQCSTEMSGLEGHAFGDYIWSLIRAK